MRPGARLARSDRSPGRYAVEVRGDLYELTCGSALWLRFGESELRGRVEHGRCEEDVPPEYYLFLGEGVHRIPLRALVGAEVVGATEHPLGDPLK